MIIKKGTYNFLQAIKLIRNEHKQILDYVYERQNEEDVQTYKVTKNEEDIILLSPIQHFYFSILGERTIEKLEGRGYLSMDEFNQKYGDFKIETAPQKKKRR